jgi:hypothetical protein
MILKDARLDREALFSRTPRQSVELEGELWGITTCFNPAGYSNKLSHFRLFSERVRAQGLKLLLVELTFGDQPYSIEEDLADRIVRLRSDTVLWHKERLLNIAAEQLPDTCDKVAWLDADILFENDGWVEETSRLLEEYLVVQPFDVAWKLPPGCQGRPNSPITPGLEPDGEIIYGAAYAQVYMPGRTIMNGQPGFAWAARRSLVRTHGLYDRFIVGGGDAIIASAMFGYSELQSTETLLATVCSQAQVFDVLDWAKRFYSDVKGSVYYVKGLVLHLWHGSSSNRRYTERLTILKEANFNPHRDISLDSNHCWRWSSEKPELHRQVKQYFLDRKEEEPEQATQVGQ